jgi:hypothetical protein
MFSSSSIPLPIARFHGPICRLSPPRPSDPRCACGSIWQPSIKRLHDRDKRGWWIIPFVVLPGSYNTLSGWWPEDSYPDMLHGLIAFIAYIWGFIEMYCLKGSRKTNRFGADPLTPPPPRDTRPPWDQQSEIEMVPHKAGPPPVWHVKPGYE